ncbi:hypothetical protein TNCV_3049171 [Trichonephila clavipes]|nr:hypothetical protein TNCV_3049171 [Trichonephila clavipes]
MNPGSVCSINMVTSVFDGIMVNAQWQRAFVIVILAHHLASAKPYISAEHNTRPHFLGFVRTFLGTENLQLLPRPAGLPDLSPIENVWSMVAERLARHHTLVTTVDEL